MAFSAIIVTTSSRKERLEDYLAVGDIHLTDDDVAAIDRAGAQGQLSDERRETARFVAKWAVAAGLLGYIAVKQFF